MRETWWSVRRPSHYGVQEIAGQVTLCPSFWLGSELPLGTALLSLRQEGRTRVEASVEGEDSLMRDGQYRVASRVACVTQCLTAMTAPPKEAAPAIRSSRVAQLPSVPVMACREQCREQDAHWSSFFSERCNVNFKSKFKLSGTYLGTY